MKKCETLDDIKKALEIVFKPDISLKWDSVFKMYKVDGLNEAGKIAVKSFFRYKPFKLIQLVTESQMNDVTDFFGKLGLCYQVELPEGNEDTGEGS